MWRRLPSRRGLQAASLCADLEVAGTPALQAKPHDCRTAPLGASYAKMNWEKVNGFVQAWVDERGLPTDMAGMSLALVDFENEADCEFFYPGRDMVSHRAFTMALAKIARARQA